LRGLSNLFATVGVECLLGPGSWFTQSVRSKSGKALAFGQVTYHHQRFRINWLLDCNQANQIHLAQLIDNLAYQAGLNNARLLLASSEANQHLFSTLRQAGFCVFGWEKYWKVIDRPRNILDNMDFNWQRFAIIDIPHVIQFQLKHLSPAVRSVVPLANEMPPDYILWQGKTIKGYAYVSIFLDKGIIAPVLESNIQSSSSILASLLDKQMKHVTSWYIKQTTAQIGFENTLTENAIPISNRRELMVKYFTIMNEQPIELYNHARERGHADPIAPFNAFEQIHGSLIINHSRNIKSVIIE